MTPRDKTLPERVFTMDGPERSSWGMRSNGGVSGSSVPSVSELLSSLLRKSSSAGFLVVTISRAACGGADVARIMGAPFAGRIFMAIFSSDNTEKKRRRLVDRGMRNGCLGMRREEDGVKRAMWGVGSLWYGDKVRSAY